MIVRQIAIGDCHGNLDLLRQLVQDVIRLTDRDMLIVLGDVIDRGRQSKQVVAYLNALRRKYPQTVLIRGNHEQMARDALTQKSYRSPNEIIMNRSWLLNNGGKHTLESFGGEEQARQILLPFIDSLPFFFETDTHIFVHGGIPSGYKDIRDVPSEELLWTRNSNYRGKPLVVGHTPVRSVTKDGDVIMVDTGAFMTNKLSGFDVLNDRVYEAVRLTANMVLSGRY